MSNKELLMQATDKLVEMKRAYHSGQMYNGVALSYEMMKAQALIVINYQRLGVAAVTGKSPAKLSATQLNRKVSDMLR